MVSGSTERFRVCHFIHVFLLIGDRKYCCAYVIICLIHHHRTRVMGANIGSTEEHTLLPQASPQHLGHRSCGARGQKHTPEKQSLKPRLHCSITASHCLCPQLVPESPWGCRRAWGLGLRHFLTLPLLNCEMWESLLDLSSHFYTCKVGVHLLQRVDIGFRRANFFN